MTKTILTLALLFTLSACGTYTSQPSEPGKLNSYDTRSSFIGTQGSNAVTQYFW
jgi:hypothetical protein